MELTPDSWYQQLSIAFADGTVEVLHIERRSTGTHIPRRIEHPEPWTRLTFCKCPCCPLTDNVPACPAALSLQTTMNKLRPRSSIEMVKATAIDAKGRSQTVEWPLQNVGSTLVQLAVFASDCPVGYRLKPYLAGLPPFVNSLELSQHIAAGILKKHGGSVEAARQELAATLTPLPDVFEHLTRRFRAGDAAGKEDPAPGPRDAVPNSLISVDAFSKMLARRADKLYAELSTELGWAETGRAPAAQPERGGWVDRFLGLFR
ncbi:MAG: hypothetical protein ABIJ96_02795 [Elusimicrobiota bacterium]